MIKLKREDYINFFKQRKIKLTDVRNAILDTITKRAHFTIHDVISDVEKQLGQVNIMSIYNNISLLLNEHLLFANTFNGKNITYEAITPELAHIKCDYCGVFVHLDEEEVGDKYTDDFITLAKKYNLTMKHFKLEIHGICQNCIDNSTL